MKFLISLVWILVCCRASKADEGRVLSGWHWDNPLPQGNDLFAVTFAKNAFLVGGAAETIITSSNARDWEIVSAGLPRRHVQGLSYGAGRFVVVGAEDHFGPATIRTSSDGVVWTSIPTPFTQLFAVSFGNGVFIAVGKEILTSPDGMQWTLLTNKVDLLNTAT